MIIRYTDVIVDTLDAERASNKIRLSLTGANVDTVIDDAISQDWQDVLDRVIDEKGIKAIIEYLR